MVGWVHGRTELDRPGLALGSAPACWGATVGKLVRCEDEVLVGQLHPRCRALVSLPGSGAEDDERSTSDGGSVSLGGCFGSAEPLNDGYRTFLRRRREVKVFVLKDGLRPKPR
jgi:hypothetical protein